MKPLFERKKRKEKEKRKKKKEKPVDLTKFKIIKGCPKRPNISYHAQKKNT